MFPVIAFHSWHSSTGLLLFSIIAVQFTHFTFLISGLPSTLPFIDLCVFELAVHGIWYNFSLLEHVFPPIAVAAYVMAFEEWSGSGK